MTPKDFETWFSRLARWVVQGSPLPPNLQTPEFVTAWDAWCTHRAEIRHPLRPTMAAEQLAMLSEMGPERAVAMIRYTITKGWQGLREPDQSVKQAERHDETEGL